MPMKWTPEADQKLFANFLRMTQAKVDYAELAKAMGPECTPKALSHRFQMIRGLFSTENGGEGEKSEGADIASTPNGTDEGAVTTEGNPKPAKSPRARKAPTTPRTPRAIKDGDTAGNGNLAKAATKRKAPTNKKGSAAKAANDVTENGDAADETEEDDGSPKKKIKKARAPRKNAKAAKNPNVEVIKREEGLVEMEFVLKGEDVEGEESSDEADDVPMKAEDE